MQKFVQRNTNDAASCNLALIQSNLGVSQKLKKQKMRCSTTPS